MAKWVPNLENQKTDGVRFLIAEDNPINLIVVTRMLGSLGYAYDAAENGEDCLKFLSENDYDLVLTDISMPGMNGVEVATHIRARSDAKKDIPIVAMTANSDLADSMQFKAAGINEVMAKPFTKSDLERCIGNWT